MTNWKTVAVPLQGGIDTKTDEMSVSPAKFVELENGVFTKRGSIRKRHGYDLVPGQDVSGNAVAAEMIGTVGDELVMIGQQSLYSYDSADQSWINQGYLNRVVVESHEIEASSLEQLLADQADSNGVTVRAWVLSGGGMEVSISNTETGAIYQKLSGGIVGTGNRPRCVKVGDHVHVVFAVAASTNLYSLPINPWAPNDVVDADVVVIASDLHADEIFDVTANSERTNALFAWYSTGANTLRYGRLFQDGSTGDKGDEGATGVITCISVAANKHVLLIAYYDQNSTQTRSRFILNVNSIMSPIGPVIAASRLNTKVSVALSDTQFFWLEEPTLPTDHEDQAITCVYGDVDKDGVATNSGFLNPALRHCGIASKGFSAGGYLYFVVKHESAKQLQNGYFLIQAIPGAGSKIKVVGRIAQGEGTQLNTEFHFPSFALSEDGEIKGLLPFQRKVASTNGEAFMHRGILEVSIDTESSDYGIEKVGGAGYVPGGIVWTYDGKEPVESGFLLFPEPDVGWGLTAHSFVDASTAGAMGVGTYSYKLYYEHFSSDGELHRSTGIPFSVAVLASKTVEITIPTTDLTHRGLSNGQGARSDISIAVYRTVADGTKYHRCSGTDPSQLTGANAYVLNDRDANSVVFTDNLTDTALLLRELDPDSGGTLDDGAPPSCEMLVSAQRRLFYAGGKLPSNRVAFSKLKIDGLPVESNEALTIELPDRGGKVTAVASLNDNLVVFKKHQIYAVSGDGPNNAGFGDFQEPVQIATDVGCVSQQSLVETPDGLVFSSEKGIYLLGKDFSVSYIGAEAEKFNNQTITGANVVPDQNLVILLTSDGTTIVFDYLYREWSTFTAHQGISATIWNGKYCYLRASGDAMLQSKEKYTDGNVVYRLKAKTGPLRVEGLQGRWAIKRFYLLLTYFSGHSLLMNLWYNRDKAPRASVVFKPEEFLNLAEWGDGSEWGSDPVWGGAVDGRDYQVSYAPPIQKVQSISLEFIEQPGAEPGKSFELAELSLMWRPLQGLGHLAPAKRK